MLALTGTMRQKKNDRYDDDERGTSTTGVTNSTVPNSDANADEQSSLFSKSSASSDERENVRDAELLLVSDPAVVAGEGTSTEVLDGGSDVARGHHVDIRGWVLLRTVDFWLLFTILGTFTGVGLMTIK